VNIICYVPLGSALHSISGSGVFIDSKGIILTNAHVAQYFLLADKGASCTIRTGSPAADSYKAALIYLPATWVSANADILTTIEPSGTGEYDFAFLAVTKSVTRNALPASFPFVPLASSPPGTGTPIVIASYGAQFLESSQIQYSLSPTVVFGSVKDIFTFKANTIDVLALGGSAAAQEGSSGGGVADASGSLVGTITTSTTKGATDTRSLDAITTSYIRSAYASETGSALDLLLSLPTVLAIAAFAPQIPALAAILTAGLP
jgi:S1-C subfamily serine protease